MPDPRRRLITFEGSEGSGKSTQIERTEKWLCDQGASVLICREPGGTPLGESIRHLLKHDPVGDGMEPIAELFLFAASRAELVRKSILPALHAGQWVLCDRFFDSTTIYQGIARQIGTDITGAVNGIAAGPARPGLTLVFDLEPATALQRAKARSAVPDRMEDEPLDFYEAVRQGYRQLARDEPDRVKCIDASRPADRIFESVQQEIRHGFPEIVD